MDYSFDSGRQQEISLHSPVSRHCPEHNQPLVRMVLAAILPEVNRSGRDADYAPPPSAEVENGGVPPPLHIRLYGVLLNFKSILVFSLPVTRMFHKFSLTFRSLRNELSVPKEWLNFTHCSSFPSVAQNGKNYRNRNAMYEVTKYFYISLHIRYVEKLSERGIWCFHGGGYEEFRLLQCYTVLLL
jgi:hypothetical protein